MLGDLGRRVRLARREDALAVDRRPTRAHAGANRSRAGSRRLRAPRRPRRSSAATVYAPVSRPVPRMRRTPCDSSRLVTPVAQRLLHAGDALAQRGHVETTRRLEAHRLGARELGELVAGRDHRLARDAVPEVRGAADDVALDHRHLGAERRRDRRRGVPAGTATDDHEPHGHDVQATRRAPAYPDHSMQELLIDELTGDARDRRARARDCGPDTFRAPRRAARRRPSPTCPFCAGQRGETPPEVARVGARRARHAGLAGAGRAEQVPDRRRGGVAGAHEVVVLLPRARPPARRARRSTPRPRRCSRSATAPRYHLGAGLRHAQPLVNQGQRVGRVDRAPARAARRARVRPAARRRRCSTASRRRARPRRRRDRRTRATSCVVRDGDAVVVVPAGVDRRRSSCASRSPTAARASTSATDDDVARAHRRAARRARARCTRRSATSPYNVVDRHRAARRPAAVPLVDRHRAPHRRDRRASSSAPASRSNIVAPETAAASCCARRGEAPRRRSRSTRRPPTCGASIEPIERHVDWMADAESITFTSTSTPRRRHHASTASRRSARSALTDRMTVTEWEPGRAMGIEHRGVVTGRGRFTLRRRAAAAAPGSPGRSSSRSRGGWAAPSARSRPSRCCARSGAVTCAALKPIVEGTAGYFPLMTNYAMSVAGMQTLGADLSLDVAREADALGYDVGVGRGGERGRGDVAARRDQPGRAAPRPRHRRARAAAAHAAAARDGRGDAAATRRRPRRVPRRRHLVARGRRASGTARATPTARSRRCASSSRCCASASRGETVTFEGDFYTVKRFRLGVQLGDRRPKIFVAALNKQMLRLGGELADGVLLNYLPASLVPWCVERVREGGDAEIHAYVHCAVTDRDRYADLARKDLLNYAVVDAYANQFARAGFVDEVAALPEALGGARSRRARSPRSATPGSTTIQIMGDAAHVRAAVQAYERPRRRRPDRVRAPVGRGPPRDRERDAARRSPDRADDGATCRRTSPCPGRAARNDCDAGRARRRCRTPRRTRRARGRARRRAAGRARRRSRASRDPSRRPRPGRARAAQCSARAPRPRRRGTTRSTMPDRERFVGAHLPAAPDQLLRPRRADQARQALRAARAGNDAEQDLGLADARRLRRDAQVARERELAARRRARSRGSRRSPDAGSPRPRRTRRGTRRPTRARAVLVAELGDVGAGRERLLAARDHDRLHRGVGRRARARRRAARSSSASDSGFIGGLFRRSNDDAAVVLLGENEIVGHAPEPLPVTTRRGNSTSAPTGHEAGRERRTQRRRVAGRDLRPQRLRRRARDPSAAATIRAPEPAPRVVRASPRSRPPSGRRRPRPTITSTAASSSAVAHAHRSRRYRDAASTRGCVVVVDLVQPRRRARAVADRARATRRSVAGSSPSRAASHTSDAGDIGTEKSPGGPRAPRPRSGRCRPRARSDR